jgi:cytochrome c-type biogenesis protein
MNKYRNLIVLSALALLIFGGAIFFQKFQAGSLWLWGISSGGSVLLPLMVVSALVDSVNPCAFSILIVSIIFLFSLGKTREKILSYGLFYILGIFAVYLLIGLGILQVLHIFNVPHFMSKVGAALLIIFGIINILETLFPKFPIHFAIPHSAHGKMNQLIEKVSLPGMFALGALVGLCEFPCTGGPYLTALGLLHDMKTYWLGAGYLILYNLIFVSPLVVILSIASNKALVEKMQGFQKSNQKWMKVVAGFLMLALAFVILNL